MILTVKSEISLMICVNETWRMSLYNTIYYGEATAKGKNVWLTRILWRASRSL